MQIAGEEVQNVDLCLELMALGFYYSNKDPPPPTPWEWSKTNVGTNLLYRQLGLFWSNILIIFTGEEFMIW